jgi:paired small multidrug resistance pump
MRSAATDGRFFILAIKDGRRSERMTINLHWYDWAGLLGVVALLVAFFLLQAGKLHGNGFVYQLLNALGAGAVLVSLLYAFNLSAFVIEACWVAISIYGMVRGIRAKRHG